MAQRTHRRGISLVELEVAFIVFAIAMSGLCPLVVMQSKHLKRIENRFDHEGVHYIAPSRNEWARKLGAHASLSTTDPGIPPAAPIVLVNDVDSGFTPLGEHWTSVEEADSFLGEHRDNDPGDGTEIARWEFIGLKPGWYEVHMTWLEAEELTTTAPVTVFAGSETLEELTVDQQVAPDGEEYAGRPWQWLGTYLISGSVLSVELNNGTADMVRADAVRLVRVENDVQLTNLEKSLESSTVTATVTVTEVVPP